MQFGDGVPGQGGEDFPVGNDPSLGRGLAARDT